MESRKNIFGIHADWQAITLCVIAASTFWFFNAMNDDHTADVSYPVEFLYDTEKLIPVETVPEKVRFNATGFGWNLLRKSLRINRNPVYINIDELSSYNYITATELLPVIKSQLDDIKVNYLVDDTINLKFDHLVERTFNLKLDSSAISLTPGYKIVSPIKLQPAKVTLRGPGSLINSMKDSFFVKIPERNIDSDYEEEINLEFELPEYISFEPEEVEVEFEVQEFTQESLTLYPELKNFPKDSSYLPEQETIILTVLIKPSDVEKLKKQKIKTVLDLDSLNPDDSTIFVNVLDTPNFIKEYFITPSSIKVERKF